LEYLLMSALNASISPIHTLFTSSASVQITLLLLQIKLIT
jgi:hypothetical protein